jgi:ethanolamine utilization protein EutN
LNLCRVVGSVVASEKHPAFHARKMMVVQPLDENQRPLGKSFLAVDHSSSAGRGDLVLVLREGNGVRQVLGDKTLPIRSLIVGVVDRVDLG